MLVTPSVFPTYAQQPSNNDGSVRVSITTSEVIQNGDNPLKSEVCTDLTPTSSPTRSDQSHDYARINWTYNIVQPDGKAFRYDGTPMFYYDGEKPPKCIPGGFYPPTGIPGQYTVFANATWISNGVIHNAMSDTITYSVKEGLFQHGNLTQIIKIKDSLSLYDWSADGRFILINDGSLNPADSFSIINRDGQLVSKVHMYKKFDGISCAYISPTGKYVVLGQYCMFSNEQDAGFYLVNIQNATGGTKKSVYVGVSPLQPVYNGQKLSLAGYWLAGWINDDQLIFMAPSSSGSLYEFWIVDVVSGEVIKHLSANAKPQEGQGSSFPIVSFDGRKVLFYTFKDDSSNPLSENRSGQLDIFDIESSTVSTVPSPPESGVAGCIGQPRLSGVENKLIVYTTGGCTHYFGPNRWIHVLSTDGNYHEKLFMTTGNTVLISPDGNSMVLCCDVIRIGTQPEEAGLYRLDFSHPMPELNLTSIILTLGFALSMAIVSLGTIRNWWNRQFFNVWD